MNGHLLLPHQVGRVWFEKLENMFEIRLWTNKNQKPLKLIQFLNLDLEVAVQDLLLKNL